MRTPLTLPTTDPLRFVATFEFLAAVGFGVRLNAKQARGLAREIRMLRDVMAAAGRADVLHSHVGPAGSRPRSCAGCRLMRALVRVRAPAPSNEKRARRKE